MTIRSKFILEDSLRNRKRLGPLGWIVVGIVILFVLACGLGWYALLTRNVSRLPASSTPSATMTVAQVAVASSPITVTPTVAASNLITWTVSPTKNANGQTIYDGPAEIKAWALRDYQAAQKWKMDHLLDRDFLIAHLNEYYSGKALEKEQRDIADSFDGSLKVISAPLAYQSRLPAPMDKPVFNAFAADGMQINLSDFNGTDWKFYDTRTRKLINAKVHKGSWGYTLEYDPSSKRWKIARLTLKYDLDDDKVTYVDDTFRAIQR